ncbi:MAG: hypothetical protein M1831_003698 [Alyxoria varia]|nr:MAG: hypothetical protein M1831_003698 [Alyxoria varia]
MASPNPSYSTPSRRTGSSQEKVKEKSPEIEITPRTMSTYPIEKSADSLGSSESLLLSTTAASSFEATPIQGVQRPPCYVKYRGNKVDAASKEAQGKSASLSNYIYVVCKGRDIEDEDEVQLRACGAYIEDLLSGEPATLTFNFVRFANVFPPEIKSISTLKKLLTQLPIVTHLDIIVMLHRSACKDAEQVANKIANIAGIERAQIEVSRSRIMALTIHRDHLQSVEEIDEVCEIDDQTVDEAQGDFAGEIFGVNKVSGASHFGQSASAKSGTSICSKPKITESSTSGTTMPSSTAASRSASTSSVTGPGIVKPTVPESQTGTGGSSSQATVASVGTDAHVVATSFAMATRAPPSRIYYSEPRQRQKRFPPRAHNALHQIESTVPSSSKQQSTLTQLDFAHPSSSRDMDDSDHDYEHEIEEPTRKRKRTKMASKAERERQKTLTQIDFFEVADSEDAEEDGKDEGMDIGQMDGSTGDERFHVWESGSQGSTDQENIQPTDGVVGSFESLAPKKNSFLPQGPFTAPKRPISSNGLSTFSTPRKSIKTEVPSSQSPADTPLSTQETPSKLGRAPLQEIPANVLAMRDQASPSSTKKPGKQPLEVNRSMEDGLENFDPDSEGKKGGGLGSHNPDSCSRSSGKYGLQETDLHDFAASVGVPDPPRFRKLSGPSESQARHSASHSRPSLGQPSQTTAESRAHPITSSMATTLDVTPQSPNQQPPTAHRGPSPSSSGSTASGTQPHPLPDSFSFDTGGSQLPSQLPEDVTPAASINNTAEIETYSDMESDSSDD